MEQLLNRICVAKLDELPVRLGRRVHVGEDNLEIAIFKLANGNIKAIENRCPHKGGVLSEGIVSGEHVFCPMHDWKISTCDGKAQGSDIGCVKTYKVEVEDNDVYLLI